DRLDVVLAGQVENVGKNGQRSGGRIAPRRVGVRHGPNGDQRRHGADDEEEARAITSHHCDGNTLTPRKLSPISGTEDVGRRWKVVEKTLRPTSFVLTSARPPDRSPFACRGPRSTSPAHRGRGRFRPCRSSLPPEHTSPR